MVMIISLPSVSFCVFFGVHSHLFITTFKYEKVYVYKHYVLSGNKPLGFSSDFLRLTPFVGQFLMKWPGLPHL